MQKKIKKILAAILSISIAFSGNGICVRAKQKLPKPVITKVYSGRKRTDYWCLQKDSKVQKNIRYK